MKSRSISLCIADDHEQMRKGIQTTVEETDMMNVVGMAADGSQLIQWLKQCDCLPDVCVIDLRMKIMNGFDTIKAIAEQWPEIICIGFSAYSDELNILHAIRCGAKGFFAKDDDREIMIATIIKAYDGNYCVSGNIFTAQNYINGKPLKKLFAQLPTERENQHLKLFGEDIPQKVIATRLNRSVHAVAATTSRLMRKLNIQSRVGLVALAARLGMFDDQPSSGRI